MADIAELLKVTQEHNYAASAGTDTSARRAPQTAGSEQRRTPQAATCPDTAADWRHQEGRREYGTTAPDPYKNNVYLSKLKVNFSPMKFTFQP